jgi:hypothetical protein
MKTKELLIKGTKTLESKSEKASKKGSGNSSSKNNDKTRKT